MINVIYMEIVISITCGAIDAVFMEGETCVRHCVPHITKILWGNKNIKESFFLSVYADRNALKVRINF